MTKTYVEFLFPGILFGETHSEPALSRDPLLVPMPKGAVGFRFFDREEVAHGEETLIGQPKNRSGWFYAGVEKTAVQILIEMPGSILAENCRINKYDRVVMFPSGHAYPLDPQDKVLPLAFPEVS